MMIILITPDHVVALELLPTTINFHCVKVKHCIIKLHKLRIPDTLDNQDTVLSYILLNPRNQEIQYRSPNNSLISNIFRPNA